jgi:glycerophosphoryl diester phosphodiesterase
VTSVFAHRGLHREVPENSVAAFLAAGRVGADGVELDVRRTRDGALVVHHDPEIVGIGMIHELDCPQLPEGIPTLAEAMSACTGMVVNVEVKNHPTDPGHDPSRAIAHQVVGALDELGWLASVVFSSFDLATCEALRAADGDVAIGWLLDWREDAHPSLDIAARSGLDAVHPFFHGVDEALVAGAHERGLAVNVWTVNAQDEMVRLLGLDVDAIITDDPALALSTRARRGPSA